MLGFFAGRLLLLFPPQKQSQPMQQQRSRPFPVMGQLLPPFLSCCPRRKEIFLEQPLTNQPVQCTAWWQNCKLCWKDIFLQTWICYGTLRYFPPPPKSPLFIKKICCWVDLSKNTHTHTNNVSGSMTFSPPVVDDLCTLHFREVVYVPIFCACHRPPRVEISNTWDPQEEDSSHEFLRRSNEKCPN